MLIEKFIEKSDYQHVKGLCAEKNRLPVNHCCYGYPYAPITASFAHFALLRSLRHGSRLAVIVAALLATVLRRMLGQSPVSVACFFQAASCLCIWGHSGYLKITGQEYSLSMDNWGSVDIPSLVYDFIHQ